MSNEQAVRAALDAAASIADQHWPETGHVHPEGALSCPASISITIRRLARPEGIKAILATLPPALTEMEVDEVATARVREWAHHDPDRRNLLAIIDRLTGGAQ